MEHNIVSREEWLEARKAHLAKEKELTRRRDELNGQLRELPWVKVEKTYLFNGPDGERCRIWSIMTCRLWWPRARL